MNVSLLQKINILSRNIFKKKIKISSEIVGSRIKPYRFKVTARHISNYAASIFDENSIYYDTDQEITAHPLFPVRISWQIIERLNQLLEIDFPLNLLNHIIQQSEYLIINKLPHADDALIIHGELAAILPHKLGTKVVLKFDYYDQKEQLRLTEFVGGILFGIKCADKGKTSIELPVTERIEPDSHLWQEHISISRLTPYIYDGCNDIVYPVHTDREYARSKGLPDIILQGTATLAMSISTIIRKELNNDPGKVQAISGKFTDIVVPPNRLCVRLLKKSEQEMYFDVTDQDHKFVLKGGHLKYGS
jgi:hypothetical protein